MPIPYFSGLQAELLIPALLWALLATAFAVVPVVFWPTVRKRAARRRLVLSICVAGAAVAGLLGALQIGPGVQSIQGQREDVQAMIQHRYGIELSLAQVADLVNGSTISAKAETGSSDKVHLEETKIDSGVYVLVHTLSAKADMQEFTVKN